MNRNYNMLNENSSKNMLNETSGLRYEKGTL
jgi:hypothetical protein